MVDMQSTRHEDVAVQRLPFRVEIASPQTLNEVVKLRALAYGKHLPQLGARLAVPEEADFEWGCEVFAAVSQLDGTVLGTFRIHTNAFKPLPLESSISLPDTHQGRRLVEPTRLCIRGDVRASMVKAALFKALYQYCAAQQVDHAVVAGRRPVDRMYDGLLFSDVAQVGRFYPMAHAGHLPHRVMSQATADVPRTWRAAAHALYPFFFETVHEDIDVSGARDLRFSWPHVANRPSQGSAFRIAA